MEQKCIKTIIKLKRALSTDWVEQNPVLKEGEPGYELDTGYLKIGNGSTPWNDLKYLSAIDESLEAIINQLDAAAFKPLAESISETDEGLPTAKQVYEAIKDIQGAIHFIGVKEELPEEANDGDLVIIDAKEYIWSGDAWVELGDESLYVPKSITIAGIPLQNDIEAEALSEAIGVGNDILAAKRELLTRINANTDLLAKKELIKIINEDNAMTPAQFNALPDGVYYVKGTIQRMHDNVSCHGLCSKTGDYINSLDYGIFFGSFNGTSYAEYGAIDGFGLQEANAALAALEQKIKDIELFKFPNAVIKGEPSISHGQISDFSATNYLSFPFLVDVKNRKFVISTTFTTGADVDTEQVILGSDYGLQLAIKGKKFQFSLSSNGTSWNFGTTSGNHVIQPNTPYKVKISWDRMVYKIEYLLNNTTYSTDITLGQIYTPYAKLMMIGAGVANDIIVKPFKGIIDLNSWNIVLNDELIWQGMDDVGLATRAAIDLANIDEAGEQKIKDVIGNIYNPVSKDNTMHQKVGVDDQGELWAKNEIDISNATPGQYIRIKEIDSSGRPTAYEADNLKYTLTVTANTQDGVTVTGQTVTIRRDDINGPIYATAPYEGQPISFSLMEGFGYHVSISNDLPHHFNPTTAQGIVHNADISVVLTYSDFSTIKTAADVKAALNAGMDLTDLVGEQITCTFDDTKTLAWDVVDYDNHEGVITLLMHDVLLNIVFEPPQALAYFENGLAAGNYTFKSSGTNYYLTLTKPIHEHGQLRATTTTFQVYEDQDATAAAEQGTVSTDVIEGAINLGTTGIELNHMDRVSYGSNNFAESGIFQWLNSDAAANTKLPRINKFSRSYSVNSKGLLARLDKDFINTIDETEWKCMTNNVYEAPESMGGKYQKSQRYTVKAKFALASKTEIFDLTEGVGDDTEQYDLYVDSTNEDRIKRTGGTAQYWWLRAPHPNVAISVRNVYTTGGDNGGNAYNSYGVAAACRIIKS